MLLLAFALITAMTYAFYLSSTSARMPVWPAPQNSQVEKLANSAGLTVLPKEGVSEHIHSHLSITLDGKSIIVPANIGIDTEQKLYSEIHTHDVSGILHVESSMPRPFYLRQALSEWEVPLYKHGIKDYTDGVSGVKILAFVNQKPFLGDLRELRLKNKQDISLSITTSGAEPKPSAAFKWPRGY